MVTTTTAFYLNSLNPFSIVARNHLMNKTLRDAYTGCNLFCFPWLNKSSIHNLPSLKLPRICAPLSFSLSLVQQLNAKPLLSSLPPFFLSLLPDFSQVRIFCGRTQVSMINRVRRFFMSNIQVVSKTKLFDGRYTVRSVDRLHRMSCASLRPSILADFIPEYVSFWFLAYAS